VTVATRRYEQRERAEAARRTRRRILDAVRDLLLVAPGEPITVDQVARTAGVARSTVYVAFGSRAGLIDAFAQDLLEHGGFERIRAGIRHPDARDSVRQGIRGGIEAYAEHRDVMRALQSMVALDPEGVGTTLAAMEGRRSRAMRSLGRRLARQGVLHDGVSASDAAHLLWVLTGFDAFDALFTGRGLPAEEVVRLLVQTAERAVFVAA
jgi:AcrR family transcriptional regulator